MLTNQTDSGIKMGVAAAALLGLTGTAAYYMSKASTSKTSSVATEPELKEKKVAVNREELQSYDWNNPLLTDLYQITMCYAEWKAGRVNDDCVFEMFFRKCPFKGRYAVFAGLDEVFRFLEQYKFTEDHVTHLKTLLPKAEPAFWEWLLALDCSSIKVSGARDGELVFPDQPLLRLEGPFGLLQLLETPLLNLTNFATLLATNASRLVLRAGKSKCIEFGLRRAQGPNGAATASKYSYLAGFDGTSNVYSSYLTGAPCQGTCAHSFIMSFEKEEDCKDSRMVYGKDLLQMAMKYRDELKWTETNLGELYAFVSFAHSYPESFTALVDSYSTMNSGIKNYLCVSLALKELGHESYGIRLDSGDLAKLSQDCKKLMKETGEKYGHNFTHMSVVASNDINEKTLQELVAAKHEIDVFGIGTNLVTCQLQPALGMVYKVVEFQGTPRMKFSEEIGKITLPGPKSVLRVFNEDDKPMFDLLCTSEEVPQLLQNQGSTELTYYTEKKLDVKAQTCKPHKIEECTQLLFEKGQRVYENGTIAERRERVLALTKQFGGVDGLINEQTKYPVCMSEAVYQKFSTKYKELFMKKN